MTWVKNGPLKPGLWNIGRNLKGLLAINIQFLWQQGLKNLEEYFEWINSCQVVVTNDSLGLHIASALNKKIIAFFGPTLASEICISNGIKLESNADYDCIPCLSPKVYQSKSCMNYIEPKVVYDAIERYYEKWINIV